MTLAKGGHTDKTNTYPKQEWGGEEWGLCEVRADESALDDSLLTIHRSQELRKEERVSVIHSVYH